MFEGWIPSVNPYDYRVNKNNSFTILQNGEEVHTSRTFRLRVQAERKAQDYINNLISKQQDGDATLDVQSVSTSIRALFGGKGNG